MKGCMVIKPCSYTIWEKMQAQLDKMFKETGHFHAYFPLIQPKSMFEGKRKCRRDLLKNAQLLPLSIKEMMKKIKVN